MIRKSIATIICLLFGLAISSAYIDPNDFNLSIFGLLFPYILIPAVVTLPFLYKNHKTLFAILLILSLYGTSFLFAYIRPFSTSSALPSGNDQLTIMSYNTMMGAKLVNNKHVITSQIKQDFDDLMKEEPIPDIICGQEVSTLVHNMLSASFKYPYLHSIQRRGAVILSKYPIVKSGQVDFGPRLNSCLWADILVDSDTIRIYSAHLESNRLTQESYDFLTEEEYESAQAVNGIKDIIAKYTKYSTVRVDQAREIKKHMAQSRHPVIICGDFNEAPISFTYRLLKKGMLDTFVKSGRGLGSSWNGGIPLLRIDYILADESLRNMQFYTMKSDLSDHYPVKAVFEWK